MGKRLRFSEDERLPQAPPKKKKRRINYDIGGGSADKPQPSPDVGEATSVSPPPSADTPPPKGHGRRVKYEAEDSGSGASSPPLSPDGGDTSTPPPRTADTPPPPNAYKRIEKLEQKSERYKERLETARNALPTQKKKSRKLIYEKQKPKSKLNFVDKTAANLKAKWDFSEKAAEKIAGPKPTIRQQIGNQTHAEIYKLENENVGVKTAHRAELLAESAYRSGKRTVRKAYRFHKNRPYRKAAKLEVKSLKTDRTLAYQKALRDNPKLKSNPVSRFFQKRAIKRKYAASIRSAKRASKATKKSAGIIGKAGTVVTKIVRRNPIFLGKVALFGLILVALVAMVSMCMNTLSGGAGMVVGALSYTADYEDIDDASILYTELETDLQIYLRNIERNYPNFDEYRYNVGEINHNPFELMAFLTAVYGEFAFAEVELVIRQIFAEQYRLSLVEEVEIRTRTETRTDAEGNAYTVTVEYEWRILNVNLQSTPMILLLISRMDEEQRQHFNVLMATRGARQIVGNPFDFNWLPHMSSRYGWRIHPIHGDKRFHAGVDIGQPTGREILAGFDGTVTSVGYDADGWGNFIVIDNGEGWQALYAHCHTILVARGASVTEGQPIATVGNTGASTGPHLHMEVIRHGRRLNPLFFVFTGAEGDQGGIQYGDARPLTPEEFAILYAEARSHLGKPYVYGANGPHAFDCSSFVAWVYRHSGIYPLARTTAQGIFNQSIPIPMSHIAPGDIVFFHSTYSTTDTVTHVGIYLGGGMMIHAGRPVNITSIHTPFWINHFFAVGRLPGWGL